MQTEEEPTAAPPGAAPAAILPPDDFFGPLPKTLHLVNGTSFAVSDTGADIRPGAAQGFYCRDLRVLSKLELFVNGMRTEPLAAKALSPSFARFVLRLPWGDRHESPVVGVRDRYLSDGLHEELEIHNYSDRPVRLAVEFRLEADFADVAELKNAPDGRRAKAPRIVAGTLVFSPNRAVETRVTAEGDHLMTRQGPKYRVELGPGESWSTCLHVSTSRGNGSVPACASIRGEAESMARRAEAWREDFPVVQSPWEAFTRLYRHSVYDLSLLLMEDPVDRDQLVMAAGMPWFMTLFGRDAIVTSLMSLPFDHGLALGVLRALARRQGREENGRSEEEPGKILHEVRLGGGLARGGDQVYYGSVDATPLFVVLVGEAWRWGVPWEEIRGFLPAVRRALRWMREYGDLDGDGYLEYEARSNARLRNQGWKDSHDGIQFADGRLPRGPIALCEVQGYKYMALVEAADLFQAEGRSEEAESIRLEAWELARRFREEFWMPAVEYPALALDGDKRPVDAVASNPAHLLWTGILTPDQARAVATKLRSPELFSGWGVRTLGSSNRGYRPVSYHAGSVWPHDTAVAAGGLGHRGFREESTTLVRALVDVGSHFGYRLPELFSGFGREKFGFPVGYPPTCNPQAWAAGSALLLFRALLGLRPDLPNGELHISPFVPREALPLSMEGLTVGQERLSLRIGQDGDIEFSERPSSVALRVHGNGAA